VVDVNYLLDTHALLWAVEGDPRLGKKASRALAGCEGEDLAVSDMSFLEIAMLERRGKIILTESVADYLSGIQSRFTVLPIGARIASEAMTLKLEQADPFDRVLVATARFHNLPMISRDRRIRESGFVKTLW
jgi:PIN domain nuclease of toxin-antitoxin system